MLRLIDTTPVGSSMNTLTLLQASTCLRSTDMHQYTDIRRIVERCFTSCPLLQHDMLPSSISPQPLTFLQTLY